MASEEFSCGPTQTPPTENVLLRQAYERKARAQRGAARRGEAMSPGREPRGAEEGTLTQASPPAEGREWPRCALTARGLVVSPHMLLHSLPLRRTEARENLDQSDQSFVANLAVPL